MQEVYLHLCSYSGSPSERCCMRGGGIGMDKHCCCDERSARLSSLLSCLQEGQGTRSSVSGMCKKWYGYAGVLPWCVFAAAAMLDFLQQLFRRMCDCVCWSCGGPTFHEFSVFWSQFILPRCTVAVSPLSVMSAVHKMLLGFLKA